MTPLELLESERDKYLKALRKSCENYKDGKVTWEMHEVHIMNIVPNINIWNDAVNALKKGMS